MRLAVGYEDMRWITVGPAGQPHTAIMLHPPAVGYDVTDQERELLLQLIAKGSHFGVNYATDDLDAEKLRRLPSWAGVSSAPLG